MKPKPKKKKKKKKKKHVECRSPLLCGDLCVYEREFVFVR